MDEHLALKQVWEAPETGHDTIGSIDPDALKIPARRAEQLTYEERSFSISG